MSSTRIFTALAALLAAMDGVPVSGKDFIEAYIIGVEVGGKLGLGITNDHYQRGYHAKMIVPPALFGHELAGVIEEVGPNVKGFKVLFCRTL